jgi:hypothetical protein
VPSGTICRAIDQNVKGYNTTDGVTWSGGTDLHGTTALGSPSSVSCLAADLCVATSDELTSTFARSIIPSTRPVIVGAGKLGETLTVTQPPLDESRAWFGTTWWRCQAPGSSCVRAAAGPAYTLSDVDTGTYVEARDDTGIGLDEEGSAINPDADFVSLPLAVGNPQAPNPAGQNPPSPTKPGDTGPAITLSVKAGKEAVTVTIGCHGPGACRGKVALTAGKKSLGSKSYTARPGSKVSVEIKLGRVAKKLLGKASQVKAMLTIDPTVGKTVKKAVTLRS